MARSLDPHTLVDLGLAPDAAARLAERVEALCAALGAEGAWRALTRPAPGSRHALAGDPLLTPEVPFAVHEAVWQGLFADRAPALPPPPAWTPTASERMRTHADQLRRARGLPDYAALHAWSCRERGAFWQAVIERLEVPLRRAPAATLDLAGGPRQPRWLAGAALNVADACWRADPDAIAILYRDERVPGALRAVTYADLARRARRAARGLRALGLAEGDAVGVVMPMTVDAVALFLGALMAGFVTIGIAESFAPKEIAARLALGAAKAVLTQDAVWRGGRALPLYAKVIEAGAPRAVVWSTGAPDAPPLRNGDVDGASFALDAPEEADAGADAWPLEAVARGPDDVTTILFSSGTTGEPKVIAWTQTTPIKAAADGHLHHDIQPGDVVAWPTSLGWMMGPWLVYAALLNRATIALYDGAPQTPAFCRFVADAGVTMLGVVPSLVAAWRRADCARGLDWSRIRCFSSTGECSRPDDMLWLMAQAGYRPVIEYMGGTEIGGGYLTGTLVQSASPATFTTPALGLDVRILDEAGAEAQEGELFIVPPSIGLSQTLLNRDHDEVYFAGAPRGPGGEELRRHGDHVERLAGGHYRAHGRVDDTMNLGGIKVSSAELERALVGLDGVAETAAIAVPPPGGGPSELVVYAVLRAGSPAQSPDELRCAMQAALRAALNPLFRVHEVRVVDALPRTASNKVMRRMLRAQYLSTR